MHEEEEEEEEEESFIWLKHSWYIINNIRQYTL